MSRQVPNPYHDLPEPLGLPPSDSQNFGSPLSGIGNNGGPSGGGGGGTPGGGPAKPTYAKRGKITIVACVPCRKRKTKVSDAMLPLMHAQTRALSAVEGSMTDVQCYCSAMGSVQLAVNGTSTRFMISEPVLMLGKQCREGWNLQL